MEGLSNLVLSEIQRLFGTDWKVELRPQRMQNKIDFIHDQSPSLEQLKHSRAYLSIQLSNICTSEGFGMPDTNTRRTDLCLLAKYGIGQTCKQCGCVLAH